MSLSTISSRLLARICLLLLLLCAGCAGPSARIAGDGTGCVGPCRIAVLPIERLSGSPAPVKEMRALLADRLTAAGFRLLGEEELERFMARHLIRYTGGIDSETARSFKEEAGVEGVLVTNLELYSEQFPPRFALTARLVATGQEPVIVWMKSVALSGDDAPGLLELGLVKDPRRLVERGVGDLVDSLKARLAHTREVTDGSGSFPPGIVFQGAAFRPADRYRVGVVPFYNKSDRQAAGELMALHFVEALTRLPNVSVIEPGIIREQLLKNRIIMEEGVSFADADMLFATTGADHIVNGTVIEYRDAFGAFGTPQVDFSALLVEKKSREVVWGSKTHQAGDDRVHLFDIGRISTAHGLAAEMVRGAVRTMAVGK